MVQHPNRWGRLRADERYHEETPEVEPNPALAGGAGLRVAFGAGLGAAVIALTGSPFWIPLGAGIGVGLGIIIGVLWPR